MATVKIPFVAKFQTSKDGEVEETHFAPGDSVTVMQKWQRFFLIKDKNGHYYNVPCESIEP